MLQNAAKRRIDRVKKSYVRKVASLLAQALSGERVLSDQKIQQLVVAQAAAISEQWAEEVLTEKNKPSSCGTLSLSGHLIKVAERVDWYDSEAKEVLLFADAIQVKRQKPVGY